LSGSINDAVDDDLDTLSANSYGSDNETSTPQKKPVELPVHDDSNQDAESTLKWKMLLT
jgi:hypothetical protein